MQYKESHIHSTKRERAVRVTTAVLQYKFIGSGYEYRRRTRTFLGYKYVNLGGQMRSGSFFILHFLIGKN